MPEAVLKKMTIQLLMHLFRACWPAFPSSMKFSNSSIAREFAIFHLQSVREC